jgi:rod shape-determining protein MreC
LFRLLRRYQKPLAVLVAIILPLLVYRANSIRPANANVLDRFVLLVTSPLERWLSGATSFVSDNFDAYLDVVHAREENIDLRRRLHEADRDRDRLPGLVEENEQLRRLLSLSSQNPDLKLVAAEVIGAGTSPLSRSIDIDRGALHGVFRGAPVISGQGLVGSVRRVGWTSSEVQLIADEKVAFRAAVTRSRAKGRVRGQGNQQGFALVLGEVLRSDDLQVGDRVETSGLDGVFPKGIPVGVITKIPDDPGAQHRAAELEPYVDFARLEEVSVLITAPPPPELITPEPLLPASLRLGWDGGVSEPEADAGPSDAEPKAPRPRPIIRADAGPGADAGVVAIEPPLEDPLVPTSSTSEGEDH